jgi:hypothetical protein
MRLAGLLQFKWRPSGSSLKRPLGAKDRNKQFFNYFINERLSSSSALINAVEREISYRERLFSKL